MDHVEPRLRSNSRVGITRTIKCPTFAPPPTPLGLNIDRCINTMNGFEKAKVVRFNYSVIISVDM